jgi:hypothetical protein
MYSDQNLINLRKEIFEFNRILDNYVISSSNLTVNEISLNIYCNYEDNLRKITKEYIECGENKTKGIHDCIKNYQENFHHLRSEISINIDKEANKLLK